MMKTATIKVAFLSSYFLKYKRTKYRVVFIVILLSISKIRKNIYERHNFKIKKDGVDIHV